MGLAAPWEPARVFRLKKSPKKELHILKEQAPSGPESYRTKWGLDNWPRGGLGHNGLQSVLASLGGIVVPMIQTNLLGGSEAKSLV